MFRKFVSIRVKLMVSIIAMVLLFGGISLWVTYHTLVDLQRNALTKKSLLVLDLLKAQLSATLPVQGTAAVENQITLLKEMNPDVLYILVLDSSGAIRHHTFGKDKVPPCLTAVSADTGIRFFMDDAGRLPIQQVSAPFRAGGLGSVVVGMDESIATEYGRRTVFFLVTLLGVLLLVLGLAAIVLSNFILRPIRVIMNAMESFSPGKALPEIRITFNDEIKLLGNKFREIMARINRMEEESRQTHLKMIETEKLASIGTLASGIAHEINNPIAGIEICAHRLRKTASQDPKQAEYVQLILEAADHAKTIVRGLLAYVRQPNQNNELVDLRWVIQFSLKLLHYRLQKKGIAVSENLPDRPCLVWGIRTHLVQVAVNGIINAIDASYAQGSISLLLTEKGEDYLLAISDEGTRVDPEVAGKAFDPFFTTKGRDGTGLGLYVSYNIVTAHKGSISLDSQPGGGARLEVLLPKAAEHTADEDPFFRSSRLQAMAAAVSTEA